MSQTLIARRYAASLLAAVDDAKAEPSEIVESLSSWAAWMDARSDAAIALLSPVLRHDVKSNLLGELLTAEPVPKLVEGLLRVCLEKQRLSALSAIADQFAALIDARNNIVRGEAVTAFDTDPEIQQQITEHLQRLLNKQPNLSWRSDASLLGGFHIQIGHTVWDASLKHQLSRLGDTIRKGVK